MLISQNIIVIRKNKKVVLFNSFTLYNSQDKE